METDRAVISVVPAVGGGNAASAAEGAPQAVPSPAPAPGAGDPSAAPEAQPPVTAGPPADGGAEPTIGGEAFQAPTPDQIVQGTGGSLADQMKARFQSIASTEEFPVPGWELPDGSPGLIIEARTFGDRNAFTKGVTNEAFIIKSTRTLFFVKDDGTREAIPGGWGPGLAAIIGASGVTKASDLVAMVISKPDPDHPGQRIPNIAGIGALAQEILNWAGRGSREAEEDLGG